MSLETVSLLKELSGVDGPSGYEDEALKVIEEKIKPYADVLKTSRLNTLIALKRGEGTKKLGIFAHVDEIGFVVAKVEERSFIRLEPIGGIDPKVVLSQRIKIFTKRGVA
ncbi:MAG TPA: M42 family peptidase, partial [Acetomicrobium sp.]|nr:M42 family peptidase [Acetomicrobium sp.]